MRPSRPTTRADAGELLRLARVALDELVEALLDLAEHVVAAPGQADGEVAVAGGDERQEEALEAGVLAGGPVRRDVQRWPCRRRPTLLLAVVVRRLS